MMDLTRVVYTDPDAELRARLAGKLNIPGRHRLDETIFHRGDRGFTIVAVLDKQPVGVIAIQWKKPPAPLDDALEAYIDLIDVDPPMQRQGLARKLIALAEDRARSLHAFQFRAWSSAHRVSAIRMWRALGFGVCPTTITVDPQGEHVHGCFVARSISVKP